jgi:hypothetical protein
MRNVETPLIRTRVFQRQPKTGGIRMYIKRVFSAVAIAVALAALSTGARAQSSQKAAGAQSTESVTDEPSILGTWNVTQTSSDGFRFRWHFTFMPGRTSDEGTIITTSSLDLVPNPVCVPEQGVWVKTGVREYAVTRETFCFDEPSGDPAGTGKWRTLITLGPRGNGLVGREHLDVYDPQGNLIFSANDTLRGMRMQVEMLPEAGTSSPAEKSTGLFNWKGQQ